MGNVLVIAEHAGAALKKATLSVLTFAGQASKKLGVGFDILVLGEGVGPIVDSVKRYGAGKVYVVDSPVLKDYLAPSWSFVIAEVAGKIGAPLVVASSSSFGKDCMPRVAVKLGAGMASDIVALGSGSPISYVRPMWAGNVLGEVEITTPVHVATVRVAEFDPAEPVGVDSPVETMTTAFDPSTLKQRLIEFRRTVSARPELTEARVVVAGGRGFKSKENFEMIYQLADLLGAAVGATRAAVDAEFITNDYQIGQTGKVVAPDLYIGIGISGAIQHLAGMKNAKVIVAINKDEEAPIFSVTDYGLVADLFKALPEMIERIKAHKGQEAHQ